MADVRQFGLDNRFRRRWGCRAVLVGCLALVIPSWFAAHARAEPVPGDTDGDCDVDLDDANNARNNFGLSAPPGGTVLGDVNGDGRVDIDDLKTVRVHFPSGPQILGPAPAAGAEIHLFPVVSEVRQNQGPFPLANWTANAAGGALISPGQGEVFAMVDLMMTIDGVGRADAVGFGNVQFDLPVVGELREGIGDISIGWLPSEDRVDHDGNPETPEIIPFAEHSDLAVHRDLLDLFVAMAPLGYIRDGTDRRIFFGRNEPYKLGSVLVTLDTDTIGTSGAVQSVVKAFSTFDDAFLLGRNDGDMTGGLVTLSVVESCPIGDTDCDGRIDIDDLNNVRNNFGAVGPDDGTLSGDTFPYDGVVNIDDINSVRNNFGARSDGVQSVPEPTSAFLTIVGLAVVHVGRRSQRPIR